MTSSTNSGGDPRVVLVGHASPEITAAILGPWARRALCADADPAVFFPAHDDPATHARQICAKCPVRLDCLQFALVNNERYGIWGGLDPGERDTLRRKLRRTQTGRRGAA